MKQLNMTVVVQRRSSTVADNHGNNAVVTFTNALLP